MHEPTELLEGIHLFEEFPGEVGLALWQTLRDVTLWAAVPADRRDGLFTPQAAHERLESLMEAGAEPTLEVSLTTLTALVGAPAAASAEIVSLVCLEVSQWAEARGAMATAMAFSQAAALTRPEEPGPALAAGSLAVRWRRDPRAETWLRRCIGLARRRRAWTIYAEAYVELGLLYVRRGIPGPAQRYFIQALRTARRSGLMDARGAALHGLLRLAMDNGKLEEAQRLARAALRAYGSTSPRMGELLYDVTQLLVRVGDFESAVPYLQRLVPTRTEPVERGHVLALLAHAAAGVNDRLLYEESWMGAWSIITRRPGGAEKHLHTLVELSRASALLNDWTHVEQAVKLASAHHKPQRAPHFVAEMEQLEAKLAQRAPGDPLLDALLRDAPLLDEPLDDELLPDGWMLEPPVSEKRFDHRVPDKWAPE